VEQRAALVEDILPLPVWDTHTHLQGAALPATSFWDIGHYFWYLQQLVAAGYPADHRSLSEDERCAAYARAYAATRNTSMHWTVARILGDLYGLEITDAASVRAADEAIRAAGAGPGWARHVCERGALRRIVVNEPPDATFDGLPDVACLVPRVEGQIREWIARLAAGGDGDEVRAAIGTAFAAYAAAGSGGVMTSLEAFGPSEGLRRLRTLRPGRDEPPGAEPAAQVAFVCRAVCAAAEASGLFLQLLLGIEPVFGQGSGGGRWRSPINDPQRLLSLHSLFRDYGCAFELVLGSSVDNLDAVQAATLFPNVNVGGMWWYNFRASTYRETMQYRLEGLPPSRSVLIASDARCIEWAYGKVVLVKHLLAGFLQEEIARGWLNREDALWVAREWLYGAAAPRYARPA
jgi:glucuronate isomerase